MPFLYLEAMKIKPLYYICFTPIVFLEVILFLNLNFSFEAHLCFLIIYIFALFFEHPNIDEYKKSMRKRLSFSFQLFSLWNFVDLNLPESKYKDLVLRHCAGIVFFLFFFAFATSWINILGAVLGVLSFEFFRYLFIKFASKSLNSASEEDLR